jgi:hypothetical protein
MAIQDLQRERMQTALSMSIPDLTAIANGSQSKHGVDSLTAVMALQIKGPAEKAARAQQAAQQPKQPTVKDQVVAQASDMGGGISDLPAENVMTEQAMASGGIVAFQGGGEIEDLTKELAELERQKREQRSSVGAFRTPAPYAAQAATQAAVLDAKIADIRRRLQLAQNRSEFTAERNVMREQGLSPAEFGTPLDIMQAQQAQQAQQGKQPPAPGAAPIGAPAGFPSVGGALGNLRGAATAYGNFDTMQFMRNVDLSQYKDFLPMTPEAVREQMAGSRGALEQMFPEKTREEVEQRIAQRYTGLEDMFKQREARGAEAVKEAEKEKGQTAGLGLMQLAAELVSKPLTKIDPSAAFQTFKEANSQFRQARKEYREGLDKIAEARELQKIGQAEKADALFREGAMARFNFETGLDKLAIAQDNVYKTGALNIADKATQAQDRKLTANLKMGEAELGAAVEGAKLGSEERRASIYAGSRMGGGRSAIEDKAQDNAKARMDQWMKSPAGAIAMAKDPTGGVFMQMQNQFYLEELAKLQGTTAAPSGGGAGQVLDYSTGQPIRPTGQ